MTSSQAAAAYLANRLSLGAPVCAVGGPGVTQALADAGLTPVRVSELDGISVAAVVQGLGIDVTWHDLAEIAYLVEGGAPWVVTNLDLMLPTARGPAPGNGALVAAVQTATTRRPQVVGKPGRPYSTWHAPGSAPSPGAPSRAGTASTPTSQAPTRREWTRCSS